MTTYKKSGCNWQSLFKTYYNKFLQLLKTFRMVLTLEDKSRKNTNEFFRHQIPENKKGA